MRLPVRGRGAGRVDDRALRGRNRHHHARRRPAAARDLDRRLAGRGDHGAMSAQRLARKAQAAASLVRDIERGLGQPIGRDARLAPQPVPGEALQKAPYRRGPHPLASAHHRAQAAEVDPRDLAIVDLAGPQAIVVAEVGRRCVRGADFRDQAQPGGRRMQKVRRRHAVTGAARYERKQGVADQPHVMVRRQPRHADGRALDRGAGIRDDVAVRHHHAPRAARGARGVLQEQHGLRRGAHSATQHARSPGRPSGDPAALSCTARPAVSGQAASKSRKRCSCAPSDKTATAEQFAAIARSRRMAASSARAGRATGTAINPARAQPSRETMVPSPGPWASSTRSPCRKRPCSSN